MSWLALCILCIVAVKVLQIDWSIVGLTIYPLVPLPNIVPIIFVLIKYFSSTSSSNKSCAFKSNLIGSGYSNGMSSKYFLLKATI